MTKKQDAAWKLAERERVLKLSNSELLDELLQSAGGDDYDGCFTTRGAWIFESLELELRTRLATWLKEINHV